MNEAEVCFLRAEVERRLTDLLIAAGVVNGDLRVREMTARQRRALADRLTENGRPT